MSPITEFYTGKTVLVTGATGYMGKVLLEKLVRSFPDIKKIYILIRSKKGCTPQERVKQLTNGIIFTFHNVNEKAYDKIEAISGDFMMENLNLSEIDKEKLIEEVSIVFHVAASIRMNLPLKEAVITNTTSTYQLFKLCMNMKILQAFVHVSTAFCNVEIDYMEEKIYPMDVDPYKIMDLVKWMDEKSLVAITKKYVFAYFKKALEPILITIQSIKCVCVRRKTQSNPSTGNGTLAEHILNIKLLGSHPNTYTFTKRLTELIVKDMGDKIPIIITRPSIVMPSLREPIAGWVDSFNGPVSLFYAFGKGILRIGLIDDKSVPQMIPVDVAINTLIVSGYERATNVYSPSVLNVTIGNVTTPTWSDYFTRCEDYNWEHPFKLVLWYPKVTYTKSYYLYMIHMILFHIIPALAIDFMMIIFLQKPFLTAIQKRLLQTFNVLQCFTLNTWSFDNTNCIQLNEKLDDNDKKIFPMLARLQGIEFENYNINNCKTSAKYLFKEHSENYSIYKLRNKILYLLDLLIKLCFIYVVLRWVLGKYF
nr:fatty acyl-CoA reductase 1-like [Onthophagus taurus]